MLIIDIRRPSHGGNKQDSQGHGDGYYPSFWARGEGGCPGAVIARGGEAKISARDSGEREEEQVDQRGRRERLQPAPGTEQSNAIQMGVKRQETYMDHDTATGFLQTSPQTSLHESLHTSLELSLHATLRTSHLYRVLGFHGAAKALEITLIIASA
ncbi:uncharacterized protein N7473_006557 [Penicillium subrubescens]|uniref:uncharacterized protein n=1 Tax=Penicillium subrubescens TaxID=1316194 RepID=UPI0025458560|nr:uncharacterized protein N7473_006557 [Penicillium subrubescens]KAJ5890329.1 hypothetical protein N7473_006557 [Penicillium subrubescens]